MSFGYLKEVDFKNNCPNCKYYLTEGSEEPCRSCLLCSFRMGSRVPRDFALNEFAKSKKKSRE